MKFGRELGTRRVQTKFLWFPRCIDGEIRWLETASWSETWTNNLSMFGVAYWDSVDWEDDHRTHSQR